MIYAFIALDGRKLFRLTMHNIDIEDLSILLVEPSSPQRKIIEAALLDGGVNNVDFAEGIGDAMDQLQYYQPDLVISSMYFDEGTGTDLILQIRNDPNLEELPFMLISSETKLEYLEPIKQAGVIAILPKPFDDEDLRRALKTAVDFICDDELELDSFDMESVRILLVDDSRMARKHISKVLSNLGARNITEAEDGQEAIDILKNMEFDLVVTDYNMPHVDGEELLQYIRNESQQKYVPVLMVTSEQNEATLNHIQQSGVSGLCDKPFNTDHVRKLLVSLLS